MKTIKLTQGKVALVDDEDYDYLMQWKWYCKKDYNTFYAVRTVAVENNFRQIYMHRVIMFNNPHNLQVDHIDLCGINNQRINLRLCTNSQNQMNKKSFANVTSKYKGVHWAKDRKKWRAAIRFNWKLTNIGQFTNEIDAAIAYNNKAIEIFGEFAVLNIIN